MDQQQSAVRASLSPTSRVSFSVSTKLLLSISILLLGLISFLSVSAIILLTEDKQAYTFETESNEAMLTGRDFANTVGHVLDTLRISLSSIDPSKPITQTETDTLNSVIQNQSDASLVAIATLDPKSAEIHPVTVANKPGSWDQNTFFGELTVDWVKTALPEVVSSGFGFINLSRSENGAMMAVIFADLAHPIATDVLPISIGLVPLGRMSADLNGLNLTVVTQSGWTIFDTDSAVQFKRANLTNDALMTAAKGSPFRNGTNEYEQEGRRYLGGFYKPGYDLIVLTKEKWERAMSATYTLTEKFILMGCMAIGLSLILTIFFSKSLTAPIHSLYKATLEVGKGNFDISLKSQSHDEIGALSEAFSAMSGQIRTLLKDSVEKAQLESELSIASTVQKTLIPPNSYVDKNVEIRSHYQAASLCGGDWWGFFPIREKIYFGVADATGHGVSAALITAAAHSAFAVINKLVTENPKVDFSPAHLLTIINHAIYASSKGGIMMTYFLGVIDVNEKTLTYANAAHNPPWIFTPTDGKYKLTSLTSSGTRIGESPDFPPVENSTVPITPEDILFFYTDGLTEGKSLDGTMFGKKQVRKIVESKLPEGPQAVVSAVIQSFMEFNEGKMLDDDVTAVALRTLDGRTKT